jgi:hypothetical protein
MTKSMGGMRKKLAGVTGVLALLYLANPGLGIFEFLPDSLPLVGNLDEGLATALLLASLQVYGVDLTRFLPGQRGR